LIEASVVQTDDNVGSVEVAWVKPIAKVLDTIQNPGPYKFQLLRSTGIGTNDFTPVPNGTFESATFQGLMDTMVVSENIDTRSDGHTYDILFFTNDGNNLFDDSPIASSVFLTGVPTDNAALLSWEYETPWNNYAFEVYRSDDFAGPYTLVATTTDFDYRDGGLENGEGYCFYVRSIGSYGIETLPTPLFNKSQIICLVPEDDVPACPPLSEVSNICDNASDDTPEEAFRNTITWSDDYCVNEEILEYNIYYTPTKGGTFELIGTVTQSAPHVFIHEPLMGIAGCYVVTNVDLNGNESDFSNVICVENCPLYNLPNVFTPNGDGANDLFIPFPYRFVERIELSVFNRWGQLVFETTDPDIRWDGTGLKGNALSDGVYHYVCRVFEQASANGNQNVQLLNGFIELIKGSK
jgi:gliding motility-associated-like protein